MTEVLKAVLSLSLSGSLVIALLALLRPLVRRRTSRRWQYYVWLIAVARLLLPFGPEGSPAQELTQRAERTAVQAVGLPEAAVAADTDPEDAGAAEPEEPARWRELGAAALDGLWIVWLAGALALAVRKITVYQGFARYIRAGWTAADPGLLDLAAEAGAEVGVKRPAEVYINPLAASPLVLGTVRPRVVLPSAELPEEDLKWVLRHELTHCRRWDGAYKWLVQLAVCVHWFNPLVHWMGREVERCCELSCDEAVLGKLDGASRRGYGDALLRTMETGGGYRTAPPSSALGESGELLKERLEAIMDFKRIGKPAAALSLALAVVLGLTAAAAGAYTGAQAPRGVDGVLYGDWEAAAHRFTREGRYQAPYMFDIGWNAEEQDESAVVALPDGGRMTVWFHSAAVAQGIRKDEKAMKALSEAVVRLWEETKDTAFPAASPVVFGYEKTGGRSMDALAEKYYESGSLPLFQEAFRKLGTARRQEWMEKFYEDGNFSFFSVAADCLDEEELEDWLDRALEDGKWALQSILKGKLDLNEDWDDDDWDWDWDDKDWEELEKQQAAEYAAHGVTMDGKNYYYQGELVDIFLDLRPDKSFYTLDRNPKGTVNVRIVRNGDGEITGAAYLTEDEIAELPRDGDEHVVDVDIDRVKGGEYVWLGTFELDEGDSVYYDLSAEKGAQLSAGFARPGAKKPQTTYMTVTNRRTDGELAVETGPMTWEEPLEPGEYSLFIRAGSGGLEDVSGYVTIVKAS